MRNKIAYHKLEIAQRNGVKSPNPLRKLACSTTAVLALSAMTLLGGCGQEPLPAGQAQFARGLELLHSGKIERADEEFAAASEVDPARPWRELGGVRKIEAYSLSLGALREYESMINLAPDFDSGYTGFCRVALRNGKTHLAKIIAQKYADQLGLDYSQAPALTESSGATGATGATGASGATGTVAAISAAERSFHLIYARVEIQNGEYARAERRLRGLLTTLPDDDEVRLALASALAAQSKMALALAEAEEALRGSGDNRAVLINGVDFYIDANQADSATMLLERLGELYPDDLWIDRFTFESLLNLGYLDWADTKISKLEKAEAPENVTWLMRAQLAESVGEFRRAYNLYLYSHSLERTNHELYRATARAVARAGNFILAEDNMRNALIYIDDGSTSEEYVADALLDFADFYLLTRQWKGSLRQMRHAEPVFEGTPRFEFMRIRALTSLLLADSADVLVGSLAGRHKTELPWLLGFIRHFIDRGAADSARAYLDLALEVAEADFGVLLAHVELAQLGGDSLEYRRALEDLVEAHPRDLRSLRLLAAYHNAGGRPALALDLADRMIEYYPGNLSSYQFAARVATREDGSAAGLRYLRLAAKNNPELPAIYHMLSVSFLRDGLSDSVENYVNRSLELDPDYIPSRLSRGLFLESQGKTDSAIAIYRGVIERDPFSAEAFNNLAWVMASNDIDPAAAANHAREAISLSGGVKANMHGTLGWAYFKQKRYKFANVAYLRAIQMDPGDPFKRYLIGINLESLGKNDEALRELRTALDLGIQGTYRQLTEQAVARLGG